MPVSGLSSTDPGLMIVLDRQLPLTLSRDSEPEPDVSVVRRVDATSRRYRTLVTLSGADRFESAAVSGFAFRVASLFE